MKIFERTTNIISASVLVACCVAFLLFGISETGWKALSIPTGSMRPTMPPGSLALVHRVPTSSLKVGDVITYINPLNPKTTLSHRIVKKYLIGGKIPGFVTKGDANKIADIPIAYGNIEGKVVWHIPKVGYLLLDAKKPMVILPIVYLAAILVTIEEVKRLSDYYKLRQPYKVPGFSRELEKTNILTRRFGYVTSLAVGFVLISAAAAPTAEALLKSNIVTLANNRISSGVVEQCSGSSTNTNNVNVTNNNPQSANSGNATNTGSGNATSGNASNSSSTNVNITTTNTNTC